MRVFCPSVNILEQYEYSMKFSTLSLAELQVAPLRLQLVQPLVSGVSATLSSILQFEATPGLLESPQQCFRFNQWPASWLKVWELVRLLVPMEPT